MTIDGLHWELPFLWTIPRSATRCCSILRLVDLFYQSVSLSALMIKERLKNGDEETVDQIRRNHFLQYFLGHEA